MIARSIISNPRVILLDEATSALDPKAEKIVQQALDNIARGRTVIIIAHRLSTIRHADKIIVLSQGQLTEEGSHDELMELGGAYSRLVTEQDLGTDATPAADPSIETEDSTDNKNSEAELGAVPSIQSIQPPPCFRTNGGIPHGLFWSLGLIVREQRSLWPIMGLVSLVSIIAGLLILLLSHHPQANLLSRRLISCTGSFICQNNECIPGSQRRPRRLLLSHVFCRCTR